MKLKEWKKSTYTQLSNGSVAALTIPRFVATDVDAVHARVDGAGEVKAEGGTA